MDHEGAVVVGLGTPGHGMAELDWAAREAQVRHRPLHARVAAVLGSASQGVLYHATCPVAVVHRRAAEVET